MYSYIHLNKRKKYFNVFMYSYISFKQNEVFYFYLQIYQQSPHLTSAGQNFPFVTSTPPTQSFAPGGVWTHPIPQNPVPRPPLRSRPLSAGSNRRSTFDIPRFQPVSTIGAPVSRQGMLFISQSCNN